MNFQGLNKKHIILHVVNNFNSKTHIGVWNWWLYISLHYLTINILSLKLHEENVNLKNNAR